MFTADFYFEFMAPGINKGNALAGSLPKIGIDASEVIAFGDAQNDISMLEWAGIGVAMGNATDAAKLRPMKSPPPTTRTASRSRSTSFWAKDVSPGRLWCRLI